MSGLQEFTPADLIDLFVDGEADDIQQATLFQALANDSDLQEEFNSAIRIRTAVDNSRALINTPPAVTQQLFSQIGIAPPAATTITGVGGSVGGGAKLLSVLQTALIPTISAIGGAAIMAIVMVGLQAPNDSVPAQNLATHTEVESLKPAETTATDSPKNVSDAGSRPYAANSASHNDEFPANFTQNSGAARPHNSLHSGAYLTDLNENSSTPPPIVHEAIETAQPIAWFADSAPAYTNDNAFDQSMYNETEFDYFNNFALLDQTEYSDISIRMRGLSSLKFLPKQAFAVDANPLINNFGIAALYRMSENHSIGIELGQETFPLFILNADNVFEESPRLQWAGLTYQYEMDRITALSGIQPFFNIVIGGSRSGPLFKSVIGMKYPVSHRLSVMLGVEGTMQSYRRLAVWLNARKLGATYGLQYNF